MGKQRGYDQHGAAGQISPAGMSSDDGASGGMGRRSARFAKSHLKNSSAGKPTPGRLLARKGQATPMIDRASGVQAPEEVAARHRAMRRGDTSPNGGRHEFDLARLVASPAQIEAWEATQEMLRRRLDRLRKKGLAARNKRVGTGDQRAADGTDQMATQAQNSPSQNAPSQNPLTQSNGVAPSIAKTPTVETPTVETPTVETSTVEPSIVKTLKRTADRSRAGSRVESGGGSGPRSGPRSGAGDRKSANPVTEKAANGLPRPSPGAGSGSAGRVRRRNPAAPMVTDATIVTDNVARHQRVQARRAHPGPDLTPVHCDGAREDCKRANPRRAVVTLRMSVRDFFRLKLGAAVLKNRETDIIADALEYYLDAKGIKSIDECLCRRRHAKRLTAARDAKTNPSPLIPASTPLDEPATA